MDEQPEPSWTNAIRGAVREFVDAVNDSSKQLASASERFAIESLQVAEEAKTSSERSAANSAEMAQQARQAAEEARNATAGIQDAVNEARELVRNEARLSVEQVSIQAAQITEIGAQVKGDLQQRIDEMVARLESGTAGHNVAMETAQAATIAAQAAAERIEMSVNAVEAAVKNAREAAEEARRAAAQSEQSVGNASMAVTSAQEAAESSRQSASLAEQAGQRSDFAAEASMLLERLETDYSLLTRLVQELHSRISSLSAVSVAPPAPAYEAQAREASVEETTEAPSSYGEATYNEASIAELADDSSWQEAVAETPETPAVPDFAAGQVEASPMSPWPSQPPADLEGAATTEEPAPETPELAVLEPVASVTPETTFSAPPSITIFGRVQMTISPVQDFDRLLSLDSAIARIKDVRGVTLADYAREEVIFRVELDKPVSVVEFARALSETAGVSTEVTEASETTLSIRIS